MEDFKTTGLRDVSHRQNISRQAVFFQHRADRSGTRTLSSSSLEVHHSSLDRQSWIYIATFYSGMKIVSLTSVLCSSSPLELNISFPRLKISVDTPTCTRTEAFTILGLAIKEKKVQIFLKTNTDLFGFEALFLDF
jgi:hypothetical protein